MRRRAPAAAALLACLFLPLALSHAARAQSQFNPAARPQHSDDGPLWDRISADLQRAEDAYLADDPVTAERIYRAALAAAPGLVDEHARGDVRQFALYRLTLICRAQNRDAELREIARETIPMARPASIGEEDWLRLWCWVQDGEEARLRQHQVEAVACWREAAELARPDPEARAYTLKNLAWFYNRQRDWRKMLACCTELCALRDGLNQPEDAAEAAEWAGLCLTRLGKESEAAPYLERAQAFWAKTSLFRLAMSYSALGDLYGGQVPRFDRSLEMFERANAAYTESQSGAEPLDLLRVLGELYTRMGQPERGLEYRQAAVEAVGRGADPVARAVEWDRISIDYRQLGRYAESRDHVNRALAAFRRAGDTKWANTATIHLAELCLDEGRFGEAARHARQALAFQLRLERTTGDKLDGYYGEPYCHELLGRALAGQGDLRGALEQLGEARRLWEAQGDRQNVAQNALDTGDVLRSFGRLSEALDGYRRGLAVGGDDQPLYDETLRLRLLRARGDAAATLRLWDEAAAAYDDAIRRLEALRPHLLDPAQASLFLRRSGGNVYAARAALALRRSGTAGAGVEAALALTERGRGQGIRQRVSEEAAVRAGLLPPGDAQELAAARAALRAAAVVRAADGQVPADAAPPGPRLGRLAAAQVRYGVVRRRLLAENPAFRRWEEPAPVSAADLADLARRSRGTLYLEWAVLDEKTTLLFALGDDGKGLTARALRLPVGAGALGRLTRGWRRALVGNNVAVAQTERQFARDLFDALLGPAERAGLLAPGRFNRLVLVPDGPLLDIPFAALEDRAGRRLVERFPLSRAISLGALCLPDLPEPAGKSAAGLDLFCAASPASPAQVASAGGRVRGSGGAATPPLRFRPLRHAAEEAKGISALFPGALTLTGGAMTESALRREMGRHAVLHFVTHGVLDPANGLGSWLLLSPEAGADPEHDGRLEAREIMGMSLSARMAVLSSCASGRGQDQGGDGVLGFAWAFRAAGCPSVVSSLWEIDDRATARLMAAFYARLRAGAAKDEALRGAMLTLRREDRTRRPFFWAAFDITGDAGPIITKKASPGR